MVNDILVILMVAFGLFAISMFVLFYVYLKRHYNNRHIDDDYKKDLDREEVEIFQEETKIKSKDEEFIPKKKK